MESRRKAGSAHGMYQSYRITGQTHKAHHMQEALRQIGPEDTRQLSTIQCPQLQTLPRQLEAHQAPLPSSHQSIILGQEGEQCTPTAPFTFQPLHEQLPQVPREHCREASLLGSTTTLVAEDTSLFAEAAAVFLYWALYKKARAFPSLEGLLPQAPLWGFNCTY